MKKPNLSFLFFTIMTIVGTRAFAYDLEAKNSSGITIYYNYISEGKELEVTNEGYNWYANCYTGYGEEPVEIPDSVTYMGRTRKVTAIGENAFRDAKLYQVFIPKSIKSIGKYAFKDCSNLNHILFMYLWESNLEYIGEGAFMNCYNIKKVWFGNIGIAKWCSIRFETAESNPLYYANHIIREPFSDVEDGEITDLEIPNGVTSIGDYAFVGCSGLRTVKMPDMVISIGDSAFYWCYQVESIHFSSNLASIGNAAFVRSKISTLSIPDGVKTIGHEAFRFTDVTDVTIPHSVVFLGERAFQSCHKLKSLAISANVQSIRKGTFEGCISLESVIIPNQVTFVEDDAFADCGLTSIEIPNSLEGIGHHAFYCDDLVKVVSHIENPFALNYETFSKNTIYNASLIIPKGCLSLYKSVEGWKDFVWIEEDASSAIEKIHNMQSSDKNCYNLNGHRIRQPQRGLNIIKISANQTRKVINH